MKNALYTGRSKSATNIEIERTVHFGAYLQRMTDKLTMYLTFNPWTPNDDNSGRTALLTSKCCILYIYSTNIGTEYFKHGI